VQVWLAINGGGQQWWRALLLLGRDTGVFGMRVITASRALLGEDPLLSQQKGGLYFASGFKRLLLI
jgi:hypothetical protein